MEDLIKRVYIPAVTLETSSVLLIPIRKNLPVFLPGKASVSIRQNPHFTHQP